MLIGRKIKKFLVRHNLIKTTFVEDGIVYIDSETGGPTNDDLSRVKFLGSKSYYGYYRDEGRKITEMFENDYPQYKGYIWLY